MLAPGPIDWVSSSRPIMMPRPYSGLTLPKPSILASLLGGSCCGPFGRVGLAWVRIGET